MKSLFKIFSRREAEAAFGIPDDRLASLVGFAEDREIRPRLSVLTTGEEKIGLEIAPRLGPLASMLKEKGIPLVTGIGTSREGQAYRQSSTPFLLSHWESLPFLDATVDLVLCRVAFLKGGLNRVLREVGRVLRPKGVAIISDLHPFSPMVQEAYFKMAVGEEGVGPGFERYFKAFREDHLELQWVREVFFDGSLKKFFTSEADKKFFEKIRRHPFLILFSVSKEG